MATNIVQATANFTSTAGILAYKEGWTVAYSSLMGNNAGYNKDSIERNHALADQIAFGASPAPSALGVAISERIFGHRTFYYNVASGGAPATATIDASIDWRDRLITGICLYRASGGAAYLPGGASDRLISAPAGDMTALPFGWYSEQGLPAKCVCLGGVDHYLYADGATGYLTLYIEATVTSYAVDVNLDYSPRLGKMNIT